jgi:uncharacterized protein DUF4328
VSSQAARPDAVSSPLTGRGHRVRPLAGWPSAAMVTIAVTALALLLYAFLPLADLWAVRAASSSGERGPAVLALVARLGVGATILLAGAAAAVCFLVWLYRAYANLAAFPGGRPRFPAGLAVGAWFIPVANCVLPGMIVAELCRRSVRVGDARAARRGAALAWLWWLGCLAAVVALVCGGGLAGSPAISQLRSAAAHGDSVDLPEATALLGDQVASRLPAAVLCLAAAVLALLVLHRVTMGQYGLVDDLRAALADEPVPALAAAPPASVDPSVTLAAPPQAPPGMPGDPAGATIGP